MPTTHGPPLTFVQASPASSRSIACASSERGEDGDGQKRHRSCTIPSTRARIPCMALGGCFVKRHEQAQAQAARNAADLADS